MIKACSCHVFAMFIVNIMNRYGQKLCRIILFHLLFVRFHYGRDRKPLIFMISGSLHESMTPKTNIICLWRHQDTRKIHHHLKKILTMSPTEIGQEVWGVVGREKGKLVAPRKGKGEAWRAKKGKGEMVATSFEIQFHLATRPRARTRASTARHETISRLDSAPNLRCLEISTFWKSTCFICLERRAPKNHEDPSQNFLNILETRSISTRKHEWDVW